MVKCVTYDVEVLRKLHGRDGSATSVIRTDQEYNHGCSSQLKQRSQRYEMLCTVTDFVHDISYRTLFLDLAEYHGAVFRGSCDLTEQNRPMDRSTTGMSTFSGS
jgi:hypothetical protein